MKKKYKCPCCGYYTFDHELDESYDICPVCFWEDSDYDYDSPDDVCSCNKVSLNLAQVNYLQFGACKKELVEYVREPNEEEKVGIIFCFNGNNGDRIKLELNEVIGFPEATSYEGGYGIICTLIIDAGIYHVKYDNYYTATGALYRFCDELKDCYNSLEGVAKYALMLENDLMFEVDMTSYGRAVITGTYQAVCDRENILHFEIDTDQTCIKNVIEDIEKIKDAYGGMQGIGR